MRQLPPIFAWTAILALPLAGVQRTEVPFPCKAALTLGAAGALLFTQGMGGTAAGWV